MKNARRHWESEGAESGAAQQRPASSCSRKKEKFTASRRRWPLQDKFKDMNRWMAQYEGVVARASNEIIASDPLTSNGLHRSAL
ncbi:hypothetical protein AMATHDRAFT_5311 [Amanita thiersii Skay4041]|uniref:Uncharacterized protein n=1 Tax=Amanita thiersii Skay4041 TaxID=703135 RepID=A0A2A9NDA7_9AGAR|nr:hypothetical protein AMATHDRAFT_5311 [Amanita thiersii Skay4041]